MDKIYLVSYSTGSYDSHYNCVIFATTDESKAIRYSEKFNNALDKWKEYYKKFESNDRDDSGWIKDEFLEYFDRWYAIREMNGCHYDVVFLR